MLAELDTRVRLPLAAPPRLLAELGVAPVRGIILYGPPGCGKSLLARQISRALASDADDVRIVAAPAILDKFMGASEAAIRELFYGGSKALTDCADLDRLPLRCVVIDEFDAIGTARSTKAAGESGGAERARDSIVNQLLSTMDGTDDADAARGFRTLAIATTNRLDLIDAALLRPGRFEIRVEIPPPDRVGREAVLRLHTDTARRAGRLSPEATGALGPLAAALPEGTSGAEIAGLVRAAASYALRRYFDALPQIHDTIIGLADLERAVDELRARAPPSAAPATP